MPDVIATEAPTPTEAKVEFSKMETLSGLRLPAELEAEMDKNYDAIPADMKQREAERRTDPPRDDSGKYAAVEAKPETPPEVEKGKDEHPAKDVAPSGDVEAESETEAGSPQVDPALLQALRLDGFTTAMLDGLKPAQIQELGSKAKERQASVDAKLRGQAEELKRAQEAAAKPTGTAEPTKPTAIPELDTALQAFKEFGDDFRKPMDEYGRALVGAARKQTMAEIQPAVGILQETQTVVRELLDEAMRREFGERFPEPVRAAKLDEARKKAEALNWDAYKDIPTLVGRYRARFSDGCRLVQDEPKPGATERSRRQALGLPSSPGKTTPPKAKTLDDDIDAGFDEVQSRWASR